MNFRSTSIHHPGLQQLQRMARLMDSQFTIPGTNIRFGLDPVLGFIPVLGEISTFVVSVILTVTMARYGGSRKLALMMAGNIILDGILGAIPFAGRIFDFYFKANDRNVRLLVDHYRDGRHSGDGKGIIITIIVALVLAMIGLVWLAVKTGSLVIGLFS